MSGYVIPLVIINQQFGFVVSSRKGFFQHTQKLETDYTMSFHWEGLSVQPVQILIFHGDIYVILT